MPMPELDTPSGRVYFTRNAMSLFVIFLDRPAGIVSIPAPLPVLKGDRVALLGQNGGPDERELSWGWDRQGTWWVDLSTDVDGDPAWVVEIRYATAVRERYRDEL